MKKNKGFSLIELIIVISIVSILAAALAPTMIHYLERGRAQRDVSAMGEVTNAIRLCLSEQNTYDDLVRYIAWGNVSCYIDTGSESNYTEHKLTIKEPLNDKVEQYSFDDDARQLDETPYYAAGNMRGVTITFQPSNGYYIVEDAIINKFLQDGNESPELKKDNRLIAENRLADDVAYINRDPDYENNGTLRSINPNSNGAFIYHRLISIVGEKIKLDSHTYRGSDYTVFIRVGSIGGREEHNQDAILVYGQFNGTNLLEAQN